MQPPYRKNENSHDGGRTHFRAEIYPEGRSRPAITASLLPKQCPFSPSRNNNFFLILLWTFLCHCFAYNGFSSQNSHLEQSVHSLHTDRDRDRTLEVGPFLPPGAAYVLSLPTQAWAHLGPMVCWRGFQQLAGFQRFQIFSLHEEVQCDQKILSTSKDQDYVTLQSPPSHCRLMSHLLF